MKTRGYYGMFGGAFIPEILVATFEDLVEAFEKAKNDPSFWQEYLAIMSTYSCRPTPLTFADNLSAHFGAARIYVKREDTVRSFEELCDGKWDHLPDQAFMYVGTVEEAAAKAEKMAAA